MSVDAILILLVSEVFEVVREPESCRNSKPLLGLPPPASAVQSQMPRSAKRFGSYAPTGISPVAYAMKLWTPWFHLRGTSVAPPRDFFKKPRDERTRLFLSRILAPGGSARRSSAGALRGDTLLVYGSHVRRPPANPRSTADDSVAECAAGRYCRKRSRPGGRRGDCVSDTTTLRPDVGCRRHGRGSRGHHGGSRWRSRGLGWSRPALWPA